MFDWAHTYCIGGLIDHELGLVMQELRRLRSDTTYGVIGALAKRFTFPRRQQPPVDKLFDDAAIRSHLAAGTFKSTASDLMSLSPVMSFYFKYVALAQGMAAPMINSIIAGFDDLSLLLCVRHGVVAPEVLRDATVNHLEKFVAAHGADKCVPKHHYSTHLWRMLARFGTLLSCLVLERLHKVPKRYVSDRRSTTSYELGCIEDVTIKQMYDRREDWLALGLVNGTVPTRGIAKSLSELYPVAASILSARVVATPNGPITCEDVVLYTVDGSKRCGQVKLNCNIDGNTISFIESWELAPAVELGVEADRYKIIANPAPYPSASILTPVTYLAEAGFATVLVPPLYR